MSLPFASNTIPAEGVRGSGVLDEMMDESSPYRPRRDLCGDLEVENLDLVLPRELDRSGLGGRLNLIVLNCLRKLSLLLCSFPITVLRLSIDNLVMQMNIKRVDSSQLSPLLMSRQTQR